MTPASFDHLLDQARALHATHAGVADFCDLLSDLTPQPIAPYRIGAVELQRRETMLIGDDHADLCAAFVAANPDAHWRETDNATDIGDDFLSRFGCYCLIGQVSFHASTWPHAMQTLDHPVMAYVIWRNTLGICPVQSPGWAT
ncbi:MAG: hypothetical protein AB8B51_06760 [Sedimentitalea sp.]